MLRLTCSLCFRLWKTTWIELHECCCTLNRCALCSFSLQDGRLFVLSCRSWTKLATIDCLEYSFQYSWWAQQRCNLEKLNGPKQCHKSSFCHHSSGMGVTLRDVNTIYHSTFQLNHRKMRALQQLSQFLALKSSQKPWYFAYQPKSSFVWDNRSKHGAGGNAVWSVNSCPWLGTCNTLFQL